MEQLREDNNSHKEDNIMESGSVIVLHIIGRGAYATVYRGNFHQTPVAVKEFHEIILSPYNMDILQREINIASQCRHPNLLQFICATRNYDGRLLIVTELMDMSLRKLIEQRVSAESRLDYEEVRMISFDVARGLHYLHFKKPKPIIHRDISSANVLLWIGNGEVRRAKLADYGSANFMDACDTANPGGVLYAAPEGGQAQHGPKIDVYSYGVLACEMCICELPDPSNRKNQIKRISKVDIRELIQDCTQDDPRRRPTMQEVIDLGKTCMRK